MMGEEAASEARKAPDGGFRRRLARACRRRLAELSVHANRFRHKAGQYRARYGGFIAAAIVVLLLVATAYLVPAVQAFLEFRFGTEEAVRRIQSLLLTTGGALIGAAAIVTSLVLFAMQVNVDRMPHGLFRRLSEDRKLLGAFALSFLFAIGVATLSTVAEPPRLAPVLVSAAWAIVFILGLFLYAYRRALRLINPLAQLRIFLDDTRRDFRRWARRAMRVRPLLEREEEAGAPSRREGPEPDAARTTFFQINAHWTAGARRDLQHVLSFARRYAERADYEVTGGALTAVVEMNRAYIEAKGRTFYGNALLVEHPLMSDAFITETLENMRRFVDWAIGRQDERQIEQSMKALADLVQVYLGIDYARPGAEKTHAHLAAVYLDNAVRAVVPHGMVDVLMEGQRLLGRSARAFVVAGSSSTAAGLGEKIAVIACAGCAKASHRPVTMEGVRQLANLTMVLFGSPRRDVGYALGSVRENVSLVASTVLKVPDTPLEDIHAATLAPYYSSSDFQSLRGLLTDLVNSVAAAEPDDEDARTVLRNFGHWANDLHRPTRELLLEAIAARSHFTIHMFQWIQGLSELLLAASNAPACDRPSQSQLRSHARWLLATLDWIPDEKASVTFVEKFQLTETLFKAAVDARRRGCDENAEEIARMLLSWTFKGGR